MNGDPPWYAGKHKPARSDERGLAIEQLQTALDEEREKSAALVHTADELRFKLEVLERGYAKQLADARLRNEATERELAEQQARLAALAGSHEETLRLLAETRATLERIMAGRRASSRPASPRQEAGLEGEGIEWHTPEDTINRLLAPSTSLRDARFAGEARPHGAGSAGMRSDELLAAETVFPGHGNDA